ncbi:MAG TPA: tetratricopeptide repeat protein [Saprospiraceae bacterium]|nr:tetratricopeptide repeat protein [Saprospiraceae bacterium]
MTSLTISAQSVGSLQRAADQYFEAGDFRNALQHYRQAGLENSRSKKIKLRIAISMYEINDIDGAAKILQSLINEGKTEAEVFFYMAKSYQARNLFTEAISHYKKFLQKTSDNNPLKTWVKDELTRCANGSRMKYADQEAYLENAGTGMNTQFSEYGVKYSPTTMDKVYFNANRDNNTDIFSTSLENGKWSTPSPLPSSINSASYDEVAGFSADGQILYFLTKSGNGYQIQTDTFSGDDGMIYKGVFKGPYNPDRDGTDLTFFNDSICLFASDKPGGYGGYDLYISVLKNGDWTPALNLGPAINTFYNERFPFLTRNGLTLFYSTDNLESIGGFDIFRTEFDPQKLTWSLPQNLGYPINSTLNDQQIVISPDGSSAFISSDRKEGHGGFDLYRVFFKQPVMAHQQISYVPTFYQTILLSGKDELSSEIPEREVEVKEYFISHLFIDENGDVLTPQNTKKLDLLANLLLIYPQIKAELSSFEIPSGQKTFSLYFSIKKAEQAADYLARKGVPKNRLLLKGYGSSFPLAINPTGSTLSPIFLKLNHRLEIGLHNLEGEPVITHIENIPVPENLLDKKGVLFEEMRHGFYYSVQIASITQILQNQNLEKVDGMFIEVNNAQNSYRYMVGMLSKYADATVILDEMIALGYEDAFIVPYLDGERLSKDKMVVLAPKYPEMFFYLENNKD